MKDMADGKQDRKNEIVIKQDTGDGLLQALLKEYELAFIRMEGLSNRTFQFLTVALLVLGFLAGYTLQPNVPLLAAWIIPLFSLTMYTLPIFFVYSMLACFWNAKILSGRINAMLPKKALIHFDRDAPEGTFFSTSRGNPKIRLMYLVLVGGSALLFPFIVFPSFSIVYEHQNHLARSLFVLLFGSLTALVLFIVLGLIIDLPKFYSDFVKKFETMDTTPPYFRFEPAISIVKAAFTSVFPRPSDVLTKGPFFIYGFIIALIIVGLPLGKLQMISFLFSTETITTIEKGIPVTHSTDWKSISEVPIWAVCALGVVYLIVEEILLQQSKLLWDDIRDVERDQVLLQNNRRAVATGRMSIPSAIRQMIVRGVLALILGYLLGRVALLMVFLLIFLHQMVYVLWAKPRIARHPGNPRRSVELLFVLSFSVPLRFLAGVVAAVGSKWSLSPFVLFFVLFYFCSFGALAAFWKMEAKHYQDTNRPEAFRSQSSYYLVHGRFWQYVGLVGAVLVGAFMVIIQFLTISCNTALPILQVLYRQCPQSRMSISYVDLGPLSVFLISGLIVVFTLIPGLLSRLFTKQRGFIVRGIQKVKGVLTPLLFLATIAFFLQVVFNFFPTLGWDRAYILFWGFLLLNAGYLFMYEGMTYLDYTMEDLRKRLPWIVIAWYAYIFRPLPNLGLWQVLTVTFRGVDLDKLRSQISKTDLDKLRSVLPEGLFKKLY